MAYEIKIEYDYTVNGRHVIRRYCIVDSATGERIHKGIVKKSTAVIVRDAMNAQKASAPNFTEAAQQEIGRLNQIIAGLRSIITGMQERQDAKKKRH